MRRLDVSTRPASEDDLSQVVKIEGYSNRPPWKMDAFRAELSKKFSHFWVLTDDETDENVFAYVVFSLPGDQLHVQTLGVERDSRRKGHARKLLRDVISFGLRNEAASVALEVRKGNEAAIKLYQGLGFVVVHVRKGGYPDGEDAYSMELRLDRMKIPVDPETDFDHEESDARAVRSKKNTV
ncbi:MAG: GNAT family N-acetyltransferase [Bdellovibrionales bacterium]|nr:GNAT family N-acetyltransferase [Bdellovibrionales bacterium]